MHACCSNEDRTTRQKRQKLMIACTMVAQGIPFIHAGFEFAATKRNNSNSYNAGDHINQMDWRRAVYNSHIIEYTKKAIVLRKKYRGFRLHFSIQPLTAGAGVLTIRSADTRQDRIELKIRIEDSAVTDPEDYPRMTYEGLLKNEPETGTKGKILGKVLQRIEQPESVILLVGTAGEDWGEENFWVEYAPGDPVAKAAKGDLIIVCGFYQGVYTYESASGEEISVPALKARQIIVR